MRYRLCDLLACPQCGAHPLDITVIDSKTTPIPAVLGKGCSSYCAVRQAPAQEGSPCEKCYSEEIQTAVLHCTSCKAEYPVIDGVPRFVPDIYEDYPDFPKKYAGSFRNLSQQDVKEFQTLHHATKKSFGFQWLRYEVTDHPENQEHFYDRTRTQPGTLGGQIFFEAGCGMGRYLKVFSDEPGAEVVGLDLSLAVNRAYEENKDNPLIHVVQGNIMELPLRPGTMDHVYSIGVLHHTPSTEQACHSVVKLLKPGGQMSVWLYHVWCPPGLTGIKAVHAKLKGAVTDGLRVITTRLPHMLLHYLCYAAVPLGWLQGKGWNGPMPLKILLSPLMLVHMSIHEKAEVRVLDTFDWYSPQYQWKHTVAEVEGWFREMGLEELNSEGFPVSVRGRKPLDASAGDAQQSRPEASVKS